MKPVYVNPIRTNVSDEMKEQIVKFCEEHQMKVSDFLREAIQSFLKEENFEK